LAVLGSILTVYEFLRRECDPFSSAAVHLHNASVYAGSPRTNLKHPKNPWAKLGAAWGSLMVWKILSETVQVGVCAGVAVRGQANA
jgi:hypothetical protein